MRTSNKKYTWADATPNGFPPDEVCDECKGKLPDKVVVVQNRSGLYKVFCSQTCNEKHFSKNNKEQ